MIAGIDYWNEDVKQGLSYKKIGSGQKYFYDGEAKSLYEMLRNTAKKYPNKIAITDPWGNAYTYKEYLIKTNVFAMYLMKVRKVCRGSRIGLMMFNSMEFCVSFLALSKLGAVCVPLPSKFTKSEVLPLANLARLEGVICDDCFNEWFQNGFQQEFFVVSADSASKNYGLLKYEWNQSSEEKEEGELEDMALLMFTSGTTGHSKAVPLKNYNIIHAIISYQRILNVDQNDKTIIPVPIYHITGLVALLGLFIYCGGSLYLHKQFHATQVLECIEKEEITFFHSSPAILLLLLEERKNYEKLSTLKKIACGSSCMPVQKLKEFHEWIPNMQFHTIYGLTETSSPGTIFPEDAATHRFIGSSGQPIPGLTVAVWNEEGEEMPVGMEGELMIRGTVVPETYWLNQNELIEADGWLHTGDMGYVNEEGYLFVTDRKKDMINYGGEKVSCYEVENAVYGLEQVQECAVTAVQNEIYGEVVGLVIHLKEGHILSDEEVRDFLKTRLAKYKIPRKIVFLENIPKTVNNKIDKKYIKKFILN